MKIAVSACLLGQKVRFDGGHKHDRFVTEQLGAYFDFVPFCPEERAFGTPRPSVRLVAVDGDITVISNKDKTELTGPLKSVCDDELRRITAEPLCGIILKSKSPSCGMGSAKLYLDNGQCEGKRDGLFTAAFKQMHPDLPMEEEGRLQDPWLRENFVMQLFAYRALHTFIESSPMPRDLVAFHASHKFLLQAKDEKLYRQLGNIVANHGQLAFETVLQHYEAGFTEAISRKSSIKRNRNVLEHMAGFFKRDLTPAEKALLHEQINDYAARIIPLITPLSTIKLLASKYETTYLLQQTFLDPYPKELALRSHIGSGK